MRFNIFNSRAVFFAMLWILVSNALIITSVGINRAGEPLTRITLTENELRQPHWAQLDGESSAVVLNLVWENRLDLQLPGSTPRYLDRDDLKALGFDVSRATDTEKGRRFYERALPREVVLAFFFNPEAPDYERTRYSFRPGPPSRLHLIDLAKDVDELLERYADFDGELLFLRGNVHIAVGEEDQLYGYLLRSRLSEINVPRAFHDALDESGGSYKIRLAVGRNLVPWVESLQPR